MGHLIAWKEISRKTWDIQNIIKGTMVNIYSTLSLTSSFRFVSQNKIFEPFESLRDEKASFVETMCLEVPESIIKEGDLTVLATRA